MSGITLSSKARRLSSASTAVVWSLVVVWFFAVILLANDQFFVASPGRPPLTLLAAATAPVLLFLFGVSLSPAVREFALTVDLKFATAVQAWRLGAYTFLILYSYGYLPGYFAWPAAIGDMFVGATAPLLLRRIDQAAFRQGKIFFLWNVFGILDLIIAVALGALGSLLADNAGGISPTTIMSQLPLVLVPTFFLPMFLVLHLIAILQAMQQRHI